MHLHIVAAPPSCCMCAASISGKRGHARRISLPSHVEGPLPLLSAQHQRKLGRTCCAETPGHQPAQVVVDGSHQTTGTSDMASTCQPALGPASGTAASALAASLFTACLVLAGEPSIQPAQAVEAASISSTRSAHVSVVTAEWRPHAMQQPPAMQSSPMQQRSRHHQESGLWLLGHSPLLVLTKKHPLWIHLAVLVAANVAGIKLVQALMKQLGDRSEPVTLVRLQLGLVHPPGGAGGKALGHLRERLSRLATMIQMGQHGLWLIVEEAALELAKHQQAAALADVEVVHMDSKHEAYDLFGELAQHEAYKAREEEASAHLEGEGECEVTWQRAAPRRNLGQQIEVEDDVSALTRWLAAQPHETWDEDSGCDDAMVVTFVVLARGHLQVPTRVRTWHDACDILKQVCGLSSTQLMAVDLTWAPSADGSYITRDSLLKDYANLQPLTS